MAGLDVGGLDVIDPRYRPLYDRAIDVLGSDPRVISVEPSGSIAAGAADQWSDLDLQIIARPDTFGEFLDDWPAWLAAITPTVFARTPIAPFIINTVTADGLTLDLAVYSGAAPEFPWPPTEYVVGMLANRRFADLGEALEYAVAEQLRGMAGPFISLVQREEHLRHLLGLPHIMGLLTTVFLAETGSPPPAKRWNDTFTEEQLGAVAALPPVGASRDAIIAFGMGVAEMVIRRARPLYPRYGLSWPGDLAAVVADRVHEQLGLDAREWLY